MKQDSGPGAGNHFNKQFLFDQELSNIRPFLNPELTSIILKIPKYEIQHMIRVGYLHYFLSAQIVKTSQFSPFEDLLLSFENLAFFHDIGKAWISSKILMKPKELTLWEYEQIKCHPVYAQKYIESRPGLFEDGYFIRRLVFNTAVFHHEWWNGKGYPYGLIEEKIPLTARITSICDAYDAITNGRPYKEARTHLEACQEIEKWAGKQFDPALVAIFLNAEGLIEKTMQKGEFVKK